MASLGTSHTATGASLARQCRASSGTACAASSVLPPPVGMRRHTQGTSGPNGSLWYGRPASASNARAAPPTCAAWAKAVSVSRAACW